MHNFWWHRYVLSNLARRDFSIVGGCRRPSCTKQGLVTGDVLCRGHYWMGTWVIFSAFSMWRTPLSSQFSLIWGSEWNREESGLTDFVVWEHRCNNNQKFERQSSFLPTDTKQALLYCPMEPHAVNCTSSFGLIVSECVSEWIHSRIYAKILYLLFFVSPFHWTRNCWMKLFNAWNTCFHCFLFDK